MSKEENKLNNEGENKQGNLVKDPDDWKTGNEPMTAAQKCYLETLSQSEGKEVDENLSKAEASKKIDELKKKTDADESGVSNEIKDPEQWKTGDEPMTAAQRSYLRTLADEAGEETLDDLTKAEAAKKIEELQQKTGRGAGHNQQSSS